MKYIINEEQFTALIRKKKEDRVINKINEDISRINKSLKSEKLINESIKDKIEIYRKRGLLNKRIVDKLNEENNFKNNPIIL